MHFLITVGNLPPDRRQALVQTIQNVSNDWFNYTTDCWILCTAMECRELEKAIKAAIGPMAYMFMVPMGAEELAHGQLPEIAWTWLRSHRLMK